MRDWTDSEVAQNRWIPIAGAENICPEALFTGFQDSAHHILLRGTMYHCDLLCTVAR